MRTPNQNGATGSSLLPPEHAEAQQFAEDALRLRRSGDAEMARSLYARAAQLEAVALRAIPQDKRRTIGIIGVSVASLWFHSGEFASARSAANELLAADLLPSARAALEELLSAIERTERKSARSHSSQDIAVPSATIGGIQAHADRFVDRLRAHLTPSFPLGPWDAAQLQDVEVAARLFDPHNRSFNTLLRRDLSVLAGRRGSGKTALLNSYNYGSLLGRPIRSGHTDFGAYDVVLTIDTYKHFDDMQRLVVRDPHAFRPVESIVDDWEAIVCDYFFARLVAEESESRRATPHVAVLQRYLRQDEDAYKAQIRELVWGVGLIDRLRHMVAPLASSQVRVTRDEALMAAVSHLESTQRRALILFDSMDEYDISNPTFNRTVAALIRFVTHFNARQGRIAVKVVLPSEIFPEITRASANPLKDLVSVDQLIWTATELAQLAAHRYRLFLELYDPEYAVELRDADLNRRQELRAFWQRFLPPMQSNRYGADEDTMTYILRHTQLLPRQLLLILQRIIVGSHRATGGYRSLSRHEITDAVESTETLIASEILRAFAHVYPNAEQLCKPVFANFATVFSFDELEDKWRKKGRRAAAAFDTDFGMPQFAEMLVRMGIVGAVADETERYFEGRFAYDAFQPINIGEGHMLCLHPIFSRHFNAAGNAKRKAIVPQGLT